MSISTKATKSDLSDIYESKPLYFHWLPIALYNVYLSALQQLEGPGEKIKLEVCGFTYTIDRNEIERATEIAEFASKLSRLEKPVKGFGMTSNLDLRKYEGAYSAIFAVALDRLCTAIVATDRYDRYYRGSAVGRLSKVGRL